MFALQHLEECRTTLLAGFKRHFRFKAAEGLLATTSLRVLSYACDAELLRLNQPIDLWSRVSMAVAHNMLPHYKAGNAICWALHGLAVRHRRAAISHP